MLAGGDPGLGGRDDLLKDGARLLLRAARRVLKVVLESTADDLLDDPRRGRGAEDLLRLALKLRLGQAHGDDGGQALENVVLGDLLVAVLQQAGGPQLLVDGGDQGLVEASDVGAVVRGGDHVHETAGDGVVPGPPLHRNVDVELALNLGGSHVAAVVEHRDRLGERAVPGEPDDLGDLFAGGQVLAELADAAVEAVLGFLRLIPCVRAHCVVADRDGEPGDEVGGLPGALGEALVGERGAGEEHLAVRPEPDPGARLRLRHPGDLPQA